MIISALPRDCSLITMNKKLKITHYYKSTRSNVRKCKNPLDYANEYSLSKVFVILDQEMKIKL